MEYIATFYSRFGAVRFKKICEETGITAKAMPVPRLLSSSCGTCVRFQAEPETLPSPTEETEQIVRVNGGAFEVLWRAADS